MKNTILEYINNTYSPVSVILYGSYADGTNNENSDFDALVISGSHEKYHDTSFVNGVQLDVFVYPAAYFEDEYDCDEFIQLFDGILLTDSSDIGKNLIDNVRAYIAGLPQKTDAEVRSLVDWLEKMRLRTKRGDAEGMFRWHWLLTDSLEIFCDIVKHPYFGPKKTLKWMEKHCPDAFELYARAISCLSGAALDNWINYLKTLI